MNSSLTSTAQDFALCEPAARGCWGRPQFQQFCPGGARLGSKRALRLKLDVTVLHKLDDAQHGPAIHLDAGQQIGIHPAIIPGGVHA